MLYIFCDHAPYFVVRVAQTVRAGRVLDRITVGAIFSAQTFQSAPDLFRGLSAAEECC